MSLNRVKNLVQPLLEEVWLGLHKRVKRKKGLKTLVAVAQVYPTGAYGSVKRGVEKVIQTQIENEKEIY